MNLPEIHKDRQNRGGEREIHINSGRDDKGKRELERKQGEMERGEGGRGGGEDGARERQRFSHLQTEGFEAFDPTPKPECISQNRFGSSFRRSPCPPCAVPGALIHSCPLCTMTFEPGKIIALEQITYNR